MQGRYWRWQKPYSAWNNSKGFKHDHHDICILIIIDNKLNQRAFSTRCKMIETAFTDNTALIDRNADVGHFSSVA